MATKKVEEVANVEPEESGVSWYDTGFDGAVGGGDVSAAYVSRVYMKENEEDAVFTFLDDTAEPVTFTLKDGTKRKLKLPLVLKEHQVRVDGDWRNWFTCLAPLGKACPICDSGDKPSQVAVFTVIDHRKWTDRDKKERQHEKRLYVVKTRSSTYGAIQKMVANYDTMRGFRITIDRKGDKSPNIGNVITKFEKVDVDEMAEKLNWEKKFAEKNGDLQPYNYLELFEPGTPEQYRRIVGGAANSPSREDATDGFDVSESDEVDF